MLTQSTEPGWNFFHLSIDDLSGIIIGTDQGAGAIVALKIQENGQLERLWEKQMTISARPAIVSDRQQVYTTDYVNGSNHLVMLDLQSGEELLRIPTPATRHRGDDHRQRRQRSLFRQQ